MHAFPLDWKGYWPALSLDLLIALTLIPWGMQWLVMLSGVFEVGS